jgi:hypothetical protein
MKEMKPIYGEVGDVAAAPGETADKFFSADKLSSRSI